MPNNYLTEMPALLLFLPFPSVSTLCPQVPVGLGNDFCLPEVITSCPKPQESRLFYLVPLSREGVALPHTHLTERLSQIPFQCVPSPPPRQPPCCSQLVFPQGGALSKLLRVFWTFPFSTVLQSRNSTNAHPKGRR